MSNTATEMLDEFSSTKLDSPSTAAPASSTSKSSKPTAAAPPSQAPSSIDEDDFAKQLQVGMADMLRELESNPEMARQFEAMMAQIGGPGVGIGGELEETTSKPSASQSKPTPALSSSNATAPAPAVAAAATSSSEDAFQDTIKRTMNRMKASSSSADAAATSAAPPSIDEDIMASLLKELQNGAGGEGGDDAFSKVLLGMMEQLTNKEILYEPMRELSTKFPAWFEENTTGAKKGTLSKEDLDRYREQQRLVGEIVGRFEKKGYSDDNAADREYIVERMQQVSSSLFMDECAG